jgi:LysR family glycine cleavage system transcriptional activator
MCEGCKQGVLVGERARLIAVELKELASALNGMDDGTGGDHGAYLMQPKSKEVTTPKIPPPPRAGDPRARDHPARVGEAVKLGLAIEVGPGGTAFGAHRDIEAVIAGQGLGIFSDRLVAPELAAQTLVKAFDLSLSGYQFYVVRRLGHPREKSIQVFSGWVQSLA